MPERTEIFLYIVLLIQILTLIVLFLIIQQINKAVLDLKKFIALQDIIPNNGGSANINIIH